MSKSPSRAGSFYPEDVKSLSKRPVTAVVPGCCGICQRRITGGFANPTASKPVFWTDILPRRFSLCSMALWHALARRSCADGCCLVCLRRIEGKARRGLQKKERGGLRKKERARERERARAREAEREREKETGRTIQRCLSASALSVFGPIELCLLIQRVQVIQRRPRINCPTPP